MGKIVLVPKFENKIIFKKIPSSRQRFFRMNKLFIQKNLLLENLSEELLPVASSVKGSFGRTIYSTGRTFFRKKKLLFF